MPRYAQIDIATARVIAVSDLHSAVDAPDMIPIAADLEPLDQHWDGEQFQPMAQAPVTEISVADFLDRWQFAELSALYTRAETDVTAKVWIDWVKARPSIRLDGQMAQEGKAAVVAWGVLTAARADVVFGY